MVNTKMIAAGLALAMGAGAAQAAFFSFASDTSDTSFTFTGGGPNGGGSIHDATGPNDFLTLQIDDNNGPLPYLSVSVQFDADFSLSYVGSIPLGGGSFSHNYLASGSYVFVDVASGVNLLTVNFDNALYTARGGATSWYTTGALQVDNMGGATVDFVWGGANLPGYGLAPGSLAGTRGFAFDLTAVNTSGAIPYGGQNPGVDLDRAGMLPIAQWWAESSYSASVNVPVPGSLALLGLGSLVGLRRRR